MEIQHLRYFVDAVEYGSFAKAAEELYVTRQTISNAVNQLENELGYTLVVRNKNGVELTPDGVVFYDRIKEQFQQFDLLQKEMIDYGSRYRASIRIGVTQHFCYQNVQYIQNWIEDNPHYHVELMFLQENEGIQELKEDKVDFIFSNTYSEANPQYISEVVAENKMALYVHKDNPLYFKESIRVDDLKGQTLLASDHGTGNRQYLDQGCMPDLSDIPKLVNDDAIYNISLLLSNRGVMISIIDDVVLSHLRNVKGIPFEGDYIYPFYLNTSTHFLRNRVYNKAYRSLKQHLISSFSLKPD